MFTGIVKGIGKVRGLVLRPGLSTISIELPADLVQALETGASVAIDGVCLTVVKTSGAIVEFDAMQETLCRTTLGVLQVGDGVNAERSARDGAEIGGHPISGHVDDLAEVVSVETPENNHVITFRVQPQWTKYIFPKGYLALNGTSLTVAAVDRDSSTFTVWFIPETLRLTTFGRKVVGDKVNFEIERNTQVIVDTVRGFLEERLGTLLPRLQQVLGELGLEAGQLAGPGAPELPSARKG
jgi:riboflavin synthase